MQIIQTGIFQIRQRQRMRVYIDPEVLLDIGIVADVIFMMMGVDDPGDPSALQRFKEFMPRTIGTGINQHIAD